MFQSSVVYYFTWLNTSKAVALSLLATKTYQHYRLCLLDFKSKALPLLDNKNSGTSRQNTLIFFSIFLKSFFLLFYWYSTLLQLKLGRRPCFGLHLISGLINGSPSLNYSLPCSYENSDLAHIKKAWTPLICINKKHNLAMQ